MAVVLSFEICESSGCNSLIFKETTGAYNASTNPTGWGAPNKSTSDAVSAVLTILLGDGTSHTINLFATGNFPTTNQNFEYEILPTQIGYASDDDQIDDQIITFTYTVVTGTTTYTQVVVQAFYCQVQCCVNTMFVELDFECDCAQNEIDTALKAFAMLQGLKQASGCGNTTNFNNILTQLNKLCANSECSACNQ